MVKPTQVLALALALVLVQVHSTSTTWSSTDLLVSSRASLSAWPVLVVLSARSLLGKFIRQTRIFSQNQNSHIFSSYAVCLYSWSQIFCWYINTTLGDWVPRNYENPAYPKNFQQSFWNHSIKNLSDMTSPFIWYMFHSIHGCFQYKRWLWRGVRSGAQLSSTETRFQKCSQSGKNGSEHPMLSISMAYNMISCKKVERNTQKLKIADFTM